jgi:hypothetical protein
MHKEKRNRVSGFALLVNEMHVYWTKAVHFYIRRELR